MPKLFHISDLHIRQPYTSFGEKGRILRETQLETFKRVIDVNLKTLRPYDRDNISFDRSQVGIKLNFDDADFLTSIYKGRYPAEEGLLPYGEPEEEDAIRALNIAEFIWQYAVKELGYSPAT